MTEDLQTEGVDDVQIVKPFETNLRFLSAQIIRLDFKVNSCKGKTSQ